MSSSRRTTSRKMSRAAKGYTKPASINAAIRKELIKQQEVKYIDDTATGTPIPHTTGMLINLNDAITQGNAQSQRISDQIKFKSLVLNSHISATVANTEQHARLMIIQWLPNSTPTLANFIEVATQSYTPFTPVNWDNKRLFKVLYDSGPRMVYDCSSGNGAPIVFDSRIIRPLQNIPKVQYDNSLTTSDNRLYIVAFSGTATASNPPAITYYYRLKYTDS